MDYLLEKRYRWFTVRIGKTNFILEFSFFSVLFNFIHAHFFFIKCSHIEYANICKQKKNKPNSSGFFSSLFFIKAFKIDIAFWTTHLSHFRAVFINISLCDNGFWNICISFTFFQRTIHNTTQQQEEEEGKKRFYQFECVFPRKFHQLSAKYHLNSLTNLIERREREKKAYR